MNFKNKKNHKMPKGKKSRGKFNIDWQTNSSCTITIKDNNSLIFFNDVEYEKIFKFIAENYKILKKWKKITKGVIGKDVQVINEKNFEECTKIENLVLYDYDDKIFAFPRLNIYIEKRQILLGEVDSLLFSKKEIPYLSKIEKNIHICG